MVGKSVKEFTFKKCYQCVTLDSTPAIKVKGEPIRVEPQIIFQRMIGERVDELEALFKYELCSYPVALFESSCLPLQANKAVHADVGYSGNPDEQRKPSENAHSNLDGGALLHRVPWPRGSTYEKISQLYIKYVTQKYGAASVVFDGYCDGPTIRCSTSLTNRVL